MMARESGTALGRGILAALLLLPGSAGAVDFLRGDTNGDGTVTVSDACFILNYLFYGGSSPECMVAADVNADDRIDLADVAGIPRTLFLRGSSISPPYPLPGPRGPDDLPCVSYGDGIPIQEPRAVLQVAETYAEGGGSRDAVIQVAFSSPAPIAGYSLRISDPSGAVEDFLDKGQGDACRNLEDLTSGDPRNDGFLGGSLQDGVIEVGMVNSYMSRRLIGAAENGPLLAIRVCLTAGLKAGRYPLVLEGGELASPEGIAILPSLVDGSLVVGEDVLAGGACSCFDPGSLDIDFRLEDSSGKPGDTVIVPFVIRANGPISGFSYSIDFDEEALEAVGRTLTWERPGGIPVELESFDMDNRNDRPGSGGLDEGYLAGYVVIDSSGGDVLPIDQEVEVLRFEFRVRDGAASGLTDIEFRDGGELAGTGVNNQAVSGGITVHSGVAEFSLVGSRILIEHAAAYFIRGDADGSGSVDITDAIFVLAHLFLGADSPACPDAADANDDGQLDISDPIAVLMHLFLGGGSLPPPADAPGSDPTPDALGCQGSN